MEKMIEINGKMWSEDTIAEALSKHAEKEAYQFQTGNVAENRGREKRIILNLPNGDICSFDLDGDWRVDSQAGFEADGYRKIGELKDYIK